MEETIKRVQTAGNTLEQKVGNMEENAILIRLDQKEQIEDLQKKEREMAQEIT